MTRMQKVLYGSLLTLACVFFALHYFHLRADFPNHSPWNDWAKYTDEGWYGDAAIRHYVRGTWRLPGDFNPAVALPVWPLMEALLFRFTGVGITAARALAVSVFCCALICCYLIFVRIPAVRNPPEPAQSRRLFAAAAVLLMAASPFLYAFTRMAILEPLLVLMVLLSLMAADHIRYARTPLVRTLYAMAVGLLVALMIGTKTTAIFLLPAIAYMLCSGSEWRLRRVVRVFAIAGGTTAVLWAVYFAVLIHHGYLQDFRYLFSANTYTGITRSKFFSIVGTTLSDGMWIGSLVYPLALITVVVALFRPRLWLDPLFTSLVLWAGGYMAFMAYHANMQPRYYLVIAVPLMLLLARGALHAAHSSQLAGYVLVPLLIILVGYEAHATLRYVMHPEYSFQTAAMHVEQIVESEPNHSHTVLSISGSNLSLMTGLPSITDDFGTMQLEDRIATYKPGWFVSWNYVEDDKMDALGKFYTLTRVGEFPAMDDPDRNVMLVYRLDAKQGVHPQTKRPLRSAH